MTKIIESIIYSFQSLPAEHRDYAVRNYEGAMYKRYVIVYGNPMALSLFKPYNQKKTGGYEAVYRVSDHVAYYIRFFINFRGEQSSATILHEYFPTINPSTLNN
jgi:hypothetical protein